MDQSQMLNRSYVLCPPPAGHDDPTKFQPTERPNFGSTKPERSNWKDNRFDKRIEMRPLGVGNIAGGLIGIGGGYKSLNLNELQSQNRLKARRFYSKKKFNNRFAHFAPRNTTSYIIRAKKSGGIASLDSPCPLTPAILPTPIFSPSRELLVDTAKEEWGVDGYGSMKGLIRLRSPRHEAKEEDENGGGSSDCDVEEHVEVERRLDHDLSRFVMIYPDGVDACLPDNRVDDQDTHTAQLEEENSTSKERIFLMERELEDFRRRVRWLETDGGRPWRRDNKDEASENGTEMVEGGDVWSERSVGG